MTMRFDEYVQESGVAVLPVDRYVGLFVEVGVPASWEPFNSGPGVRVWVCRSDPRISEFCANAVLTMHRVEAALDASEVFGMLAEQQVRSVPGCREVHREIAAATEGLGVAGMLALQIADGLGVIDSSCQTRIISTEGSTLIAQLTVTALHDSPVDRTNIWLKISKEAVIKPVWAPHIGYPTSGTQDRQ
jgi:hypothetical protein